MERFRVACDYNFNPLAPHGANRDKKRAALENNNFNSLAPRGANLGFVSIGHSVCKFQLTRPAWGEPQIADAQYMAMNISTHSPRVGRTHRNSPNTITRTHFNSLAPRGANRRTSI